MTLATNGDRIQLVETWRVLITHHQIGIVATQAAVAHEQVVVCC